jgi:mRNA-degrading endonuclease YafQ of YafQ-DinJ toxin-antitoxin module
MRRALFPQPGFLRLARKLQQRNPSAAEALTDALRLLQEDAFDPRLKTHKLKGNLSGAWAARFGYDARIIFEFRKTSEGEVIDLLAVGTHDRVY